MDFQAYSSWSRRAPGRSLALGRAEATIRLFDAANETWLSYMKFDPSYLKADCTRLLDNASAILRKVPSYVLRASLTGHFLDGY